MVLSESLVDSLFNSIVYESANKILKINPFRHAIDKAIDKLKQEKQFEEFELRAIDINRGEICNNIYLTDETTFLKKVIDNGIKPETALKLYRTFSEKFNENIMEAAKKEPIVFFSYAIGEFEKNKKYQIELIELLTKFAHEKNVNQKGILKNILNEIKELKKISINIPNLQDVLAKNKTFEGVFFRYEPAWVDYEQGFIVERKEVDEIIKKLGGNRIQLVLGAPASGKSIILKNVGFELAKMNKNVYVVELKKHSFDEIKLFFENIPKIYGDSIFIVDDAHLYLSYCERLAKEFKSRSKGNLIIGSRESREITEEHPKEGAEYEFLSELSKTCIHVQAEDVTERMIGTFLEKQYHFNKDKIETVSEKLEKFKNDLWFLSWALKAYKIDTEFVEINEVYKKIVSSIEKIKIGKDENGKTILINAGNVLLLLAVFYRFEIPIERYFLEQMSIEGNIINQLVEIQEIIEKEEIGGHKMLSLNHSSIAKLYFGSYQNFKDLGRGTKEIILNGKDEENLEFCSFHRYMTTTDPRNSIDVIISLDRDSLDENDGKKLLKNLIEEKEIQETIKKGINKEGDIGKIGRCLLNIANTNKGIVSKLVDKISLIELEKKMLATDASGNALGLAGISKASLETGMKLANIFVAKVDSEEAIENINWSMLNIAHAAEEVLYEVVNKIDIDILSLKINKEEDIETVGRCLSSIAKAYEEVALKLVDSVSARINKEEDLKKVGSCILIIARASKEVAVRLANSIDFNVLSSKINKEDNIKTIGECIYHIAKANRETWLKLVDGIDIDALVSKINKEEDIGKIGRFAADITWASKEVALKLIDNIDIDILSSKIEQEEDVEKIRWCVQTIRKASGKVGLRLVDNIDIDALSSKINKEKDIDEIKWCVYYIEESSKEAGLRLVNQIDIDTLLFKINKEKDIGKIKFFVQTIENVSIEVATKITNNLNPILREEMQKEVLDLSKATYNG